MDQNSSNNGTGKTNWREKLGIGANAKEIPKISDEFKPAGPAANSSRPQRVEPKIVARPAPRAPHPVAKPAPMAPRPPSEASQRPAMRPPRPAQVAPPPPAPEPKPESLAERLKSQRQAAERLAEQRVSAVRDSVREAKPEPAPVKAVDAPKTKPLAAPPTDAPKFTFAQEELASAKADTASESGRKYVPAFQANNPPSPAVPPLVPPRPALGGEKAVLPPTRHESGTHSGASAAQPVGYRPLDPPAYQPQRPLPPATPPQRSGYGDPANADQRQTPTARREAFENGRRSGPSRLGSDAADTALPIDDMQRGRRPLPQRPRRPASYDDDLGEVFEDEEAAPPPRRRAKAQDYSQAYREYEDTYEEDERRSAGPWLLLLALLALALLAFGGIWYYSKFMAPQGAQQTGEAVPVVPAQKQPDKVVQPDTAAATVNAEPEPAPAVKKKLIYDRILGDQAIEGGKLVPTEEAPAPVQPAPELNQQPAPAAGAPENQGLSGQGATPPPQPMTPGSSPSADPGANGGVGQPEPLPLPVPPTPGSGQTQGALPPVGNKQTATMTPDTQVSPASVNSSEIDSDIENPAATATADNASQQTDEPILQQDPSPPQIEDPAPPAKLKAKTVEAPVKAKKKVRVQAQRRQSREPTVLVPPSDAQADQPAAELVQTDTSSGSFFGSGKGTSRSAGKQDDKVLSAVRTNFSSKQPDPNSLADTQVASVDPVEPSQTSKPDSRPAATSSGSYVAQLASFRSEAEAMSEFGRLKAKHGGILGGMSPRVSKGTVGGTTRYRLGVGPMASRDEASRLCNSLIASGERDCIVKQR